MKSFGVLELAVFLGIILSSGSSAETAKWLYPSGDDAKAIMESLRSMGATEKDGSYRVSGLDCRSTFNGDSASCAFRDELDAGKTKTSHESASEFMNHLQRQGVFGYREGADSLKLSATEIRCGGRPTPGFQNPYEPPLMEYFCTIIQ